MKKLILAMLMGCVVLFSGCASVVNGTHETIKLDTAPVKGAACHLQNSKGKYYLAATPGEVKVHRDNKDLMILCSKKNWSSNDELVSSDPSKATIGNIFVGGIIGMVVDANDSANFYYPNKITVPLKQVNSAAFKPTVEKLAVASNLKISKIDDQRKK